MNKRKKKTLIWVVVALVVVIAGIFSFGNFGKQKEQTVTVGSFPHPSRMKLFGIRLRRRRRASTTLTLS